MQEKRENHFPSQRLRGTMIVAAAMAVALFAFIGCRSAPEEAFIQRQPIFGTWRSSANGWFLKIHSDGRVEIDRRDDEPSIRGYISRGGDQVNIRYHGSGNDCGNIPGLYRFRRESDGLVFQTISDDCIARRQFLEGRFTRITAEEPPSPREDGE